MVLRESQGLLSGPTPGIAQPNEPVPDVSIIVPVFNEKERLDRNLSSLLRQERAPRYEVIYIDDCSTDGSWEKLVELSGRYDCVRIYRLRNRQSIGRVRALAVSLATSKTIANADADCEVPPDWLSKCYQLSETVDIIGFPVVPPSDLEYLHRKFVYQGSGQYQPGELPHGCGALMKRDKVVAAGNFPDTDLGEDTKLFAAMARRGARTILLDRPAIRLMEKRTALRDHLLRYHRMGRNADTKSRVTYTIMLSYQAAAFILAASIWLSFPLVAWLLVAMGLVPLANPTRVLYYVRNFRFPRFRIVKAVYFTGYKILETLSLLSGFISLVGHRVRKSREAKEPQFVG